MALSSRVDHRHPAHDRCQKEIVMATDYGKVVVTDIKIPFGSMVILMVKWAVATIPALIILTVIGSITFALITALLGGGHMKILSM